MGTGMVRALLRAGHEVSVYNRTRDKAEALAKEGAQVAASLPEVCLDSEAVVSMLSDDSAVDSVVFSEGGLASSLAANAAHISSSTISTAMARRLATEHSRRGQAFLSAPVFGRPDVAETGKLLVVAGGPSGLVERFRPLFDAVGRQTFLAGAEPWQANALKLCGNFMIAGMFACRDVRRDGSTYLSPSTYSSLLTYSFPLAYLFLLLFLSNWI